MLEGHLLSERYLIKKTIGGGGMANVYLAEDTILDRDVAIKVLRMEYSNDEEFIARFDREAQAASSLSHPNIVDIYDVGEENHILYMVMEYVDGLTLKEYIQLYGPIDVPEALDIMKQITSAIAHAHANNLVHRDIKPQNILIDTYGKVKVTDFGIATALSATALTQTNSILGSVHYLSPEQARGGVATKLSDIYSLGIVLYELLTGRIPFSGQSPVSIALKHLQTNTPSVRQFNPEIPQSVENIVLKATAKDPFHRYDSVYDMHVALETALNPDNLNEDVYTPPVEVGEETKAIPIITEDHIPQHVSDDTIIHQKDESTKIITEKEGKKPKKTKRRKKKTLWILSILFILMAAGLVALFVLPGLFQPKDVTIPDVTGLEYEEAVEELQKYKLNAEKELTHSNEVDEDLVVKTEPKAGRTAKEGNTITVFISQGKETVVFDDYVGRDYSQVERLLKNNGFEDEIIVYEKNSDQPVGQIITQIQPTAGSDVVPGETKVIFEVSVGPEKIRLNNLQGLSEQQAKDYLDSHGLTMNKSEEYSETVAKGNVLRQQPAANAEVEKGTTVNVVISRGPEEKTPDVKSITFTVPYEAEELEEGQEPAPQTVLIYVEDMNNNIAEVFREDQIMEDKQYTITLTIAPDKEATYKVVRDQDLIIEKTVSYKEGE